MMKNETVQFDFAGKHAEPVVVLVKDLPERYAFAVYRDNPKYHSVTKEDWFTAATMALETWAAQHNHMVTRIHPEPGRPFNLLLEYGQ
jgi:hypothetical protein